MALYHFLTVKDRASIAGIAQWLQVKRLAATGYVKEGLKEGWIKFSGVYGSDGEGRGRPVGLYVAGDQSSLLAHLHEVLTTHTEPGDAERLSLKVRQYLDWLCLGMSPAFAPKGYQPPEHPQPPREWVR